ncbi:MAG: SMI1/KNR4 family protein [Verrucomicrobiales bacterium]|nr:SMI1/KNR4 family protein [Verrucomicrobiales bacterium]
MNPDLERAAQALDSRLELLEIPRSKLPVELWQPVEDRFPGIVPEWFKRLLADFAFMEVYLDLPRWDGEPYGANFNFWTPEDGEWDRVDLEDVAPKGWFPFAEEADGNFWAFRAGAPEDSPIILIEHTGGGLDCENGWYYAAHNLAHLLSVGSISAGRKEHLLPSGFVDLSKSGFQMWGDEDSFLIRHGIKDAKAKLRS